MSTYAIVTKTDGRLDFCTPFRSKGDAVRCLVERMNNEFHNIRVNGLCYTYEVAGKTVEVSVKGL